MYRNHKEIPTNYRRMILEETLEKRVSKVPLSLCNEIIMNYLEMEEENETLKNFQVEYIKEGVHRIIDVVGRQKALVEVDRILEYGDNKDKTVVIAIRQANRLINGYVNGEWLFPNSKDKIRFVSRRSA